MGRLSCRVGKPTSDRDVVPSLSEKIREESGKFALHCPLDGEGHRLGTFRSYHRRVRQIKAGVGTLYWVAAFRYTALRCRQPYAVEQQSLEACHL